MGPVWRQVLARPQVRDQRQSRLRGCDGASSTAIRMTWGTSPPAPTLHGEAGRGESGEAGGSERERERKWEHAGGVATRGTSPCIPREGTIGRPRSNQAASTSPPSTLPQSPGFGEGQKKLDKSAGILEDPEMGCGHSGCWWPQPFPSTNFPEGIPQFTRVARVLALEGGWKESKNNHK